MSRFRLLIERLNLSLRNARDSLSIHSSWDQFTSYWNEVRLNAASSNRRRRRRQRNGSIYTRNGLTVPPHLHSLRRHERSHASDPRFFSHWPSSSPTPVADKDKNIMSAVISILVIATIATAVAQPKWFSIRGEKATSESEIIKSRCGSCNRKYIGLQEFFYVGTFSYIKTSGGSRGQATITNEYANNVSKIKASFQSSPKMVSKVPLLPSHSIIYYGNSGDLKNCVTPEIVSLQRMIIALCFFAIIVNLMQFFLDTLGTTKNWINFIRRNAIGSIFGVVLTIIIIGVSYTVANLLEKEQKRAIEIEPNSSHSLQFIEIRFELSYYLISFAGILGLVGAACNLFRKPSQYYSTSDLFCGRVADSEANTLLDDQITSSHWHPPTLTALVSPPHQIPPPPYSP
ncbi:hypothetical protein B4U79_11940 [Dinothrombium tinctorium]|uniref:Transmembrane protein 127 transmembrane region domain-containing protein n=1 Tax=Dinothrombium tinctorium TaxID=1965070 RepID=A0A3S3NWL5_9ACAR|nr:hypothetical protein B4U79_11940 [Dinothrombium tinctorium]